MRHHDLFPPKKKPRPPVRFSGYAIVTAILREADPRSRKAWLAKLAQHLPLLVQLYEHLHLTYEDMLRLDEKSLQTLVHSLPNELWAKAWSTTSKPLKRRIVTSMSKQRQQDFAYELKRWGHLGQAQSSRIQLQIARQLSERVKAGTLRLRSKPYLP